MMLHLVISFILASLAQAAPRYPTGYRSYPKCEPQGTPKYGHKWCHFQKHQSEVGSICWFSCIEGLLMGGLKKSQITTAVARPAPCELNMHIYTGYHLRGAAVTQCTADLESGALRYNSTAGHCEQSTNMQLLVKPLTANAPILRYGKNGPFLLHSYDPSAFVIHVDASTEVTLKSYYYLAFYVQSPGLNGVENTVSFRVQGSESRYISANETRVYADDVALDNQLQLDRATFWIKQDQFYEGYSAFESYTKKDHYVIHKSRKIQLSKVENEEDRILASFIWTPDL